jgi:hypothetical protein
MTCRSPKHPFVVELLLKGRWRIEQTFAERDAARDFAVQLLTSGVLREPIRVRARKVA